MHRDTFLDDLSHHGTWSQRKDQTMSHRILSGMRATGNLHLGNYFGAIKQFLDLEKEGNTCFYFIADLHAFTEVGGPTQVDTLSVEVAKNYLACGVDNKKSHIYRQSDIPEVSEIAILLGNIAKVGRLERCTTFKERIEKKKKERTDVSFGLLGYPVLMAADILCVRTDKVPVGEDQTQHVEMTRDFARTFNRMFGEDVFVIPEMNIQNPVKVPGIDGSEKMGKSDGNTIALLDTADSIRKKVMAIPTQAETGGEMLGGTVALFKFMELCSSAETHASYLKRYNEKEEKFFGEMKRRLADDIIAFLAPIQERYFALRDDDVRLILSEGAKNVRPIAASVLSHMQKVMGLRPR